MYHQCSVCGTGPTALCIVYDISGHYPRPRGIPNYNHKKGKITFARASTLRASEPEEPMVSPCH